jgi:hypothetical protein
MAEQTVTPPNPVSSAYEEFLETFRATVEDANLTVHYPGRPIRSSFLDAGDNTRVVFTVGFYLKDWPCRRLQRGKRLDVVIKAMETFVRPGWQLTRSTVYVNYIVVSGAGAKLVQALHYDFVESGQNDHPFFHVQLSDELMPEADLKGAGCELDLPRPAESNECWVTTRIPTPDMTLASVLYCLVADHLGEARFAQFSQTVASIEDRLPPPAFESIKNSLDRYPRHFKSSHWFAHMRAGQ